MTSSSRGDDVRSQLNRAGAAFVAAAATVALAAGLTTPAAAVPAGAGDLAAPSGAPVQATTRIALLTGDKVVVDAKGKPVGIERAKGREHVPVSVQRVNGHVRVVPYDAQRLIDSGKLDARLFDVTELSRPEYQAARRAGIRLIVQYNGTAPAAKGRLRQAPGSEVRRTFTSLNAEAVTAPQRGAAAVWEALTDPQAGTAYRTTASGIAKVWLDGVRKASLDKSTRQIGAPAAWAAGYDGKGVKIAVLDTGVDATHSDLAGQVVAEKNFTAAADAGDRFGHGTHVASIAAGTGAGSAGKFKGVAPGAKLLNGKVLDDSGYGDDSGIVAGMEWAAAQGADVVNLSLGGTDQPGIDPLEAAVNKLSADKGILFAIAAGNDGAPSSVGSPGSADAALTVGAVDDKDRLAGFSSQGPRVGDGAVKPDVTAPGVDITAAAAPGSVIDKEVGQNPKGYLTISGTSMATPHVAGAAALLKQQHPEWKGAELKGVLTASTKPGKYTPFQQGSGRIAVGSAIKQNVIAEPVSVSFGRQQWPHTDDKPVTKKVTYRNLGTQPVTLDLKATATGPDGKPAPAGFFALGARQVTVPAGGTASVDLTADTRIGGTLDGSYSAYVVATGGGTTVRTAAAVDREVESYDVKFKHLARDGKPAKDFNTMLAGTSGLGQDLFLNLFDPSGTSEVRLPKGDYILSSSFVHDPRDFTKGVSWVAQPVLKVGKNGTVTIDARTTKPVDITVPSAIATSEFAAPGFEVSAGDSGWGFGWWLDSYKGFRTAHRGGAVPAGTTVVQTWDSHWTEGPTTEYHMTVGGKVKRLANGFTRHVKASELATVKVAQGTSLPGKQGALSAFGTLPGSSGSTSISIPRRLPATATLRLAVIGDVKWEVDFDQLGGRDEQGFPIREGGWWGTQKAYKAGKTYRETFNTGVFGPSVSDETGIYRDGNHLMGYFPLLTDGAGHQGDTAFTKGSTVLLRDGKEIVRTKTPFGYAEPFELPAGSADYRLTTTLDRGQAIARTTSRVEASWTFRSKKTAEFTKLPASVVRFTPELALDSTAPAGRTLRVPVTVQGSAKGSNLKSLAVYVSFDNGTTWKKLTVKDGAVSVRNPAKGKAVSLRAVVTDKQGNTAEVKVFRAYTTR
ncbi:S8 family peptidase [Streptomyces sp. NPDC101132]|uniref:S8 family peptidase n=1 Tax=Streptomyces sp. NPDC101132 TaxID=3366110 RepID=UPI0037FB5569